jgi:hypothetical protein
MDLFEYISIINQFMLTNINLFLTILSSESGSDVRRADDPPPQAPGRLHDAQAARLTLPGDVGLVERAVIAKHRSDAAKRHLCQGRNNTKILNSFCLSRKVA